MKWFDALYAWYLSFVGLSHDPYREPSEDEDGYVIIEEGEVTYVEELYEVLELENSGDKYVMLPLNKAIEAVKKHSNTLEELGSCNAKLDDALYLAQEKEASLYELSKELNGCHTEFEVIHDKLINTQAEFDEYKEKCEEMEGLNEDDARELALCRQNMQFYSTCADDYVSMTDAFVDEYQHTHLGVMSAAVQRFLIGPLLSDGLKSGSNFRKLLLDLSGKRGLICPTFIEFEKHD